MAQQFVKEVPVVPELRMAVTKMTKVLALSCLVSSDDNPTP